MAGVNCGAYSAAYTVAKHGVVGLTGALAVEYLNSPLRVNCVCPGGWAPQVHNINVPEGVEWSLNEPCKDRWGDGPTSGPRPHVAVRHRTQYGGPRNQLQSREGIIDFPGRRDDDPEVNFIEDEGVLEAADGRAIGWMVRGPADGKVVGWFHGQPGSRRDLRAFIEEALSRHGIRLLAIDRAGYGSTQSGWVGS